MKRDNMLNAVADESRVWDFVVIGGGATGLGTAVEAAARGYQTLLVEQSDFAKGTSSRSTKLIHGGVRYLRQGNVSLVLEALHERGLLTRNAPHLVSHLPFIVPHYSWWEAPFYGVGLKLYDMLAGQLGLGPSKHLSREETLARLPTLEADGLRGGVIYFDAQFDDARLAITLARTLVDLGGVAVNYLQVLSLTKENDVVNGVVTRDLETRQEHRLKARVVINATGVFSDAIRRLDDPEATTMIRPSQGAHIVLDQSFLPGETAIMVPRTDDGRVLFAIPWQGRVLVGTTDTPVEEVSLEPRPFAEEIEFLLTHAARYLTKDPTPSDILCQFAGLRPLVKGGLEKETASVPRDHTLTISRSGLVTIAGGKWTTYRKMAEDTVNKAALLAGLPERASVTTDLKLHGAGTKTEGCPAHWQAYGTDADALGALAKENPEWRKPLHPRLPYTGCEVIWAARHELARTVEDVLSRRTRALLLDARASLALAPQVAEMLAKELGHDEHWQRGQITAYEELGRAHLPAAPLAQP